MDKEYDAIIIGAGIIGCCIALELARKGYRTLNVDKEPAAGYGSTSASCAIIRTHYSTFDGTAMAFEAFHYWTSWRDYLGVEDERGTAEFKITGCSAIRSEVNENMDAILGHLKKAGVTYEEWDLKTLKERIPVMDLRSFAPVRRPDDPGFGTSSGKMVQGAVFMPQAGYISDPQLATHNVQRAAEAHGAAFEFNSEVVEIRRDNGRVIGVTLNDARKIDAPVAVNAAGPHSSKINHIARIEEGLKIKTRALRREVAHVPSPAGFDFEKDGFVTSDRDIGVYYRPEVGNHILVGSVDPECDGHEFVDPDDLNTSLTQQAAAQVYRLAQRFPEIGIPNQLRGVVGCYDVSDDWIPIYDKSDLEGFYLAIGTSGNQFKNAPVAGALMAELINACEKGHDHDRNPLQFWLRYTNRPINVGFYSRRRDITLESSFSVMG